MRELSKEYLIEFYSSRLKRFGESPEALRWTAEGQKERYGWLMDMLRIDDGDSVLDYGCGLGDLCGFITRQGRHIRYTGADINPELIERASRRYPEGRFLVMDVEEDPLGPDETYDHIVLCGVFNNRVEGATQSLMNVISLLHPLAEKSLAATALSAMTSDRQPDINYIDPDDLLSFAKRISPDARLIQHHRCEDIAVVLGSGKARS